MKVDYFYGGQFRRVLLHVINTFNGFQVQNGVDANMNPKYKTVPCLYADMNRMTQYDIAQGSENILNSAPYMTINVRTFKIDRANTTSPAAQDVVLGKNKQDPITGQYSKELDTVYHVKRYNPVPWVFEFDLNIWTTTLTNKMELLEQIITLFNPSVQLQLSTNPLDWTGYSNIELTDSEFSSRTVPQGTDTELDVARLTFKTTVWFSLPAQQEKAVLINQIVDNINIAKDEQDFLFNDHTNTITDVYSPRDFCLGVEKLSDVNSIETYELTLLNKYGVPHADNGAIFSWSKYLEYLDSNYKTKTVFLKFMTSLEDTNPVKAPIIVYGTGDNINKVQVQVDTTNYTVVHTVKSFVIDDSSLSNKVEGDIFIHVGDEKFTIGSITVKSGDIFGYISGMWTIIAPIGASEVIYNEFDSLFYKYNTTLGWYRTILGKYTPGFWRIGFQTI